ncbi:putative phage tail protein [Amphibacillus sediminis]|uniref:putative phage tail protein n=1 Tax=Amphibacillus sediminis TaxID=360185 RepID=UPI00082FDA8D|nr:putative phage tail protein [Amphibacillus sediminis]
MNRVMNYLPGYYRNFAEFIQLSKAQTAELDRLTEECDRLLDNQFVTTADERSISRRERMLAIRPNREQETLDERKLRILNRYQTKPPFTIRYLQQQLDFLLGANRSMVAVDSDQYLLTVTTSIDDAFLFKEMEYTISTIKPANLLYQQETSLVDRIVVKEIGKKQSLTRATKLGRWRLGQTPFATREEEVILFD